jgi:hypothetical protein
MKELKNLVDDLKKHLATKEKELELLESSNSTSRTAYTEDSLSNRRKEIERFELYCKKCLINEFNKKEIIDNFKKDANKIKLEIDKIIC